MDMDMDLTQRFSMWRAVVFLSPGDIWQFLEMFLVVTAELVLLASSE